MSARPHGLSAFVRCKNEEEYIVASITSAYRVFDEVVVALNNSTDRTRALLEDLMTDHPKIRLVDYDQECAPAGPGYMERVEKNPDQSLAKYYNWCLGQTTYSHVCKWDGDMIALPTFERVRALIALNDAVAFDGYDVLGRETTNSESRIFRYDPAHTRYEDWDLYEVLKHEYPKLAVLEEKCYLHMKLVKKDWLHKQWVSPNDFASTSAPAPGTGSAGRAHAASSLRNVLRRALRKLKSWRKA
jgi:glycosyltransferase involved in cell wall biosynthesis